MNNSPRKRMKHSTVWPWTTIFWISLPILSIVSLAMPSDWPEIVRWVPTVAQWYTLGRMAQQRSVADFFAREIWRATK